MSAFDRDRGRLPVLHYDFDTTGLVVFDMLEVHREAIEAAGSIGPTKHLIDACRAVGVPIFYARADHRADGADRAHTLSDTDKQFRPWGPDNRHRTDWARGVDRAGLTVLEEIAPAPGDYDVPKHRWSAFHGTHLELSLRSRGIDTILLVGGSVHVGIASTAYDARDRDFQITVVPECCHGLREQREFFLANVFPMMCNVRRLDDVITGLRPQRGRGAGTPGGW